MSKKTNFNLLFGLLSIAIPNIVFSQNIDPPPSDVTDVPIHNSIFLLTVTLMGIIFVAYSINKTTHKVEKNEKKRHPFLLILIPKWLLLATFIMAGFQNLTAQVQNNGTLYVGQQGLFYVNEGNFCFGTGSTTKTSIEHIAYKPGRIIFGENASYSNAGGDLFINGYAGTLSASFFELPIGSGAMYTPIAVKSNNISPAVCKFTPGINTTITVSNDLLAIIPHGEWSVNDTRGYKITWNSDIFSNVLPGAGLNDIAIAQTYMNPDTFESIRMMNQFDIDIVTGSITSGSITGIPFGEELALAIKKPTCFPAVALPQNPNEVTFNGTIWSSIPNIYDKAIITASGETGSFSCNTLMLGDKNITLTGAQTIIVSNEVTGTGKIIMNSESSFVQLNPLATAPTIELTKTTRPLKRFDYVYWGSPVSGDIFSQLDGAQVSGNAIGAFDRKYKYISGDTATTGGWQPLTETETGKGFIMRVKDQAPFTNASTEAAINLKFTGTANNGTITVPVTKVDGDETSAKNNNLVANPYPSAINAEKFITQNYGIIDGVIYLWKASTSNSGLEAYTPADYVAFTKAGSSATAYSGIASTGFNGKIASGQGFKVKALTNGSIEFNNCMRETIEGSNSQFFRTTDAYSGINDTTKDRFKVNLQTSQGNANQILVAYLPETSLAYDYMYDAEILSVGNTKMYSILDNDNKKLAINARPVFSETDQVGLGFEKADTTQTQMTITLNDREGVFANNRTPIYLFDKQLNSYHNFANGGYSFTTSAKEDNNRFKIVYQADALVSDVFENTSTIASLNDKKLIITSLLPIKKVWVYDITGRLIMDQSVNGETTFNTAFNQPQAIYIVKIGLENELVVTSKLINQN
jgi:hypothetical protein